MPYYPRYNQSQLEPGGFYNPSMAGPDWARGIGFYLNQFAQRKQQKDAQAQEEERYSQEQGMEERKMGIEQQRADAYQQAVGAQATAAGREPGVAQKAELDHRYQQLVANGMDPKRASGIVYGGVDSTAQQQGPSAAEAKEQRTRIQKYIDSIVKRYDTELKRLRTVKENIAKGDLPGGPKAIEQLDNAIKNLGIAAGHVNGIASRYAQNPETFSGLEMNQLRDYAMGIERTKENPFITSGRDMPDSQTVSAYEQSIQQQPPGPEQGQVDPSQIPPHISAAMEQYDLTYEEAMDFFKLFTHGPTKKTK